ncbi:MAG: exosome complex exonuclease Rrp41 [Candidatus Woesearchaeota archaeon]|nr:exosome complex exonuclease Rrp41 [Candidatus Woesearchaeota archaeon]
MSYKKRLDGRKFDELRSIEAKVGVVKNATGSAYFKIGNTMAYAAVYGPRDLFPRFLKDPKRGLLRCNYNMMPFSGMGERVRPGPSRRSKEISMVTEGALLPVVNLENFPNSVVDVYIELPQTDAGSRCAGICAASMALADAGIAMKDLVGAVSVGLVDGQIVLDLNYDEEAYDKGDVADIPMAYIPNMDKFSLLQMDGKVKPEDLIKALELAKKGALEILKVQRNALKHRFEVVKNE